MNNISMTEDQSSIVKTIQDGGQYEKVMLTVSAIIGYEVYDHIKVEKLIEIIRIMADYLSQPTAIEVKTYPALCAVATPKGLLDLCATHMAEVDALTRTLGGWTHACKAAKEAQCFHCLKEHKE